MVDRSLDANRLDEEFTDRVRGLIEQFWQLYRVGKNTDALEKMKQAVELQPDATELRNNYAHILGVTGHTREAEIEYLKIVEKDPNYYHGLGSLYYSVGEKEKAVECYRKLISKPTYNIHYAQGELARIYEEMGDYDSAVWFGQALAFTSLQSLMSVMQTLLKTARKSGDREKAIWFIKTIIKTMDALGPATATIYAGYTVYLSMAEALMEYGDYTEAAAVLVSARDAARCSLRDEVSPLVDKAQIFRGSSMEIDQENNEFTGYYKSIISDKFKPLMEIDAYKRLVTETKAEIDSMRTYPKV